MGNEEISEIRRLSQQSERLSTSAKTQSAEEAANGSQAKREAEAGAGRCEKREESASAQGKTHGDANHGEEVTKSRERELEQARASGCPRAKLKHFAHTFKSLPSILKKRKKPSYDTSEIKIKTPPKWENLKKSKRDNLRSSAFCLSGVKSVHERGPRQYVQKVIQARSPHSTPGVSKYMNKYYTSKYRGVHQTFPTRRWEAQFRKSGKPTSLGCFNTEEEAARAYDTMMIWCMIHQPENARPDKTITNFSISDYDAKIPELTQMTQEDLVLALRRLGRKQAHEHSQNSSRGAAMLHPLADNSEEARIRDDLGLGNKDPTCKQMYDRISERAPDFLPEKAKGGKYVLGTLKMQRTTLVKAYLKWLDSRSPTKKSSKAKQKEAKAEAPTASAANTTATETQQPQRLKLY